MTTERETFRFLHPLRVRWAEVDPQGIVFNPHYLTYVDTASTDYWRALAFPYPDAFVTMQRDIYVKKADIEYHGPARFDDRLEVGLRCRRIGTTSLHFEWNVFRQLESLASGGLVYVLVDPSKQRAEPVPDRLRQLIADFEAGESMIEVRTGSYMELTADARQLRRAVFVEEQGIAETLDWDGQDRHALHAVAYSRLGLPLATARLLRSQAGQARLGRLAVRRSMRGAGVGQILVRALIETARARSDREVVAHAQLTAQGFFERAGFVPHGPVFEEACIPHRLMVRTP